MEPCETAVFSNDYYDLILEYDNRIGLPQLQETCKISVDSNLSVIYVNKEGLPPVTVENYTYSAIPNCFSALSTSALETTDILRVQNIPTLGLKGEGVLIGVVDTGIEYENPIFQYSDGTTRIQAIWDQTAEGAQHPVDFPYGREYTREEINEALLQENPKSLVPEQDASGHGTSIASIAAGNQDQNNQFSGAAPFSELAVVKLKRAKPYLYEFWHLNPATECYQENDIILGVEYLVRLADRLNRPLVLCIALGSNMGSRGGNGPLSEVLNSVGAKRHVAVVVAAGNEAAARHHFSGSFSNGTDVQKQAYQQIEISVGRNVGGFVMELWALAPELYSVEILSPTGERVPRIQSRSGEEREYQFLFENATVSVDYRIVGLRASRQLIFLRFTNPTEGLWNIYVYADQILEGRYQAYLPMTEQLKGEVIFISSNPNETITIPGLAQVPMTVAGLDDKNSGVYINSGRGFTETGAVKPDFAAPAVNVSAAGTRNQFITLTGTSAASAITAGAVALFMEWAIVRGNEPDINSVDIKNYFLRGAVRGNTGIYPNREVGA